MTTPKMDQFDNPLARDSSGVALQSMSPGYDYSGMSQQTMVQVNTQQPVTYREQFTWCHFIMSVITFILGGCCCLNPVVLISSIMGIVYSGNAYVHHGGSKYGKARHSNSIAKVFWIISLVLILLTFVAIIILVSVLVSAADSVAEQIQYTNGR